MPRFWEGDGVIGEPSLIQGVPGQQVRYIGRPEWLIASRITDYARASRQDIVKDAEGGLLVPDGVVGW